MASNHTRETNYQNQSHGQDNYSPFGPVEYGWDLLAEYEEQCEECGEMYHRRISITPNNMVDNVRTRCACLRGSTIVAPKVSSITAELNSLFWPWNMVNNADKYKLDKCVPLCPEHEKLINNLKTYVHRFTPGVKGICFFGLAGRGKTHYALCVANELREKAYSVLAVKSVDLLNRLRKCYASKDSEQELQVMKVLKQVDLLIIDDIGTERPNGWVKEKLYEVIDYRHGRNTTVFTTNLGGKDLSKELGQALASRIYGAGYLVRVTGEDRRLASVADFSDLGEEISEFELEMRE